VDQSDLFYIFVRAYAASILVHDALYVCRDGKDYVLSCFLPVFGLRLAAWQKAALHVALAACCVALIVSPSTLWLYPICLLLLSTKIASYSLRLANHLILAWFTAVLLTVAWAMSIISVGIAPIANFVLTGVAGFILLLYFFAFFHKLNREYLCYQTSCATAFVDFFCWDRTISNPRLIEFYRYFAVYGTLALEAVIPVLLAYDKTRSIGFLIAVIFHYILGLMGIINFSMFMYAGLLVFMPPAAFKSGIAFISGGADGWLALGGLSAVIIAISWKWTPRRAARHCPYRYRKPAWIIQTAFAFVTAVLLIICLNWIGRGTPEPLAAGTLGGPATVILVVLLSAFFLNGISPYLGNKTEFSFAMFSNLRIEPWTHLIIPKSWRIFRTPQYIELHSIEGLPRREDLTGNRAAELSLHVLSQPDRYRYSRYFFREALRELCSAAYPHPTITICYTELGKSVEARLPGLDGLPPCLRVTRFPFVMPKDQQARHSEQGSLLLNPTDRQLF
jgi:hypothetical protein